MSHDPSRKHFFAKLIGLIATAGLVPKLLAKPLNAPVKLRTSTPIQLRPETRAVARREGSA